MTITADDTTLILNGSCESMIAALYTLEFFGIILGLKINTDEDNLDCKKYSQDQLIPKKLSGIL